MSQEYIKGVVESIYFQNDTNFYKVLLVRITQTDTSYTQDDIVVTGTFGQIHTETEYLFHGQLVEHAKYGLQFQVTSYTQSALSSEKGLIHYLSSDKFPGIGQVLATRIVECFGADTISQIVQNSPKLKEITGLTVQKREMLVQQVKAMQGENHTIIQLFKYGFSDVLAYRIFQFYQEKTIQIIEENPYSLVEHIEGIGFAKADQIGEQLGFSVQHRNRLRGGIYFTLKELSYAKGDTYYSGAELLKYAIVTLEKSRKEMVDEVELTQELLDMARTGIIIEDNGRFALPSLYYAEEGIATAIKSILSQEQKQYPSVDLDKEIEVIEKQLQIVYSQAQKNAIKKAISSPLSILTGGPGTGKTTVLNGIVALYARLNDITLLKQDVFSDQHCPILLGAPTGRAAKRMKELTGLAAMTLHRMLGIGLNPQDTNHTQDTYINELEGSFLIIDEMSMVDTWLMNWVLKAVPYGMQVLLVGDKYQLPSVGPGQVLHDLLESGMVPYTELTKIYRQDEHSTIVTLAHHIKDGYMPSDFTTNFSDRSYFQASAAQVPKIVQKIVEKAKERGYSLRDIQVLAPLYKGQAGINHLNQIIQDVLNPRTQDKQRQVEHFDRIFRVGDKVLQLVNQPEQSVFNGDIGEIEAIFYAQETEDKVDELIVVFDGNQIRYKRSEWHNLTLAYCCSIHKAQGSEFPLVILPLVKQYGRMLRRDLLYTALTRSKKSLILCGEIEAFQYAIEHEGIARCTLLSEKLTGLSKTLVQNNEAFDKIDNTGTPQPKDRQISHQVDFEQTEQTDRILSEDTMFHIDPMIGMDNITPYDFMPQSAH
ncbi:MULTISPECIES: ATP-dependent RecD-like DNA helicase [unclassified Granulicatella]|uniref:SF1B family DNA helicase RecD2 n=1 Tax=unclassified Granulicatella TaxID=2630493 RepID=UPI001074730C|nr:MULTISPECIES: ATP-dependent RecD-like DNA helicase [unclassified Granulicatella]MBF0780687.1 ATP-dependent RecD-like DNA helicase [Granulicatella sp. 19428wC4_WM01]TFU94229.1 ATP-dependent RecD-like DNA helicase [Granulicatella sp. WM01]